MSVVFPAPLCPSKAVICPLYKSIEIPFKAWTFCYRIIIINPI